MDLAVSLVMRRGLRIALALHSRDVASKKEWEAAMVVYRRLVQGSSLEARTGRLFVITDGGTPDTTQRRELDQLWGTHPVKTAVILPGLQNPIKRGVVTALTWGNPAMSFFTPERVDGALAHLGLEGELAALLPDFLLLQERMPPNLMLKLVGERASSEASKSLVR
jgi:hypothetical protein